MLTPEELQTKQLEMQQQSLKINMYIGIAGLIISMLSLYWMSQPSKK
jgi:plastocyanin domain-containing protein